MSFKKIYDSLHRFIHIDKLEAELIGCQAFQRLNHIHQLGMAFLVYPGGTHTRFEHSLGVMEIASRIYDQITIVDDGAFDASISEYVPSVGSKEHLYWRRVLRMAALCHDMGHLPFSHSAEKRILGEGGHETWTLQIILSEHLRPIWDELNAVLPERDTAIDVAKIAIGREKLQDMGSEHASFSAWERIVSDIITGDFFGADRIDYLLRDARYTGLPYGMFDYHQLIESLRIIPSPDANPSHALELGIDENGIESSEALLLSRYFMHKRLCQYPSVKAYGFHVARFMERFYASLFSCASVADYLETNENEILAHMHQTARCPQHPGYVDAAVLLKKRRRFKAIPLWRNVSKKARLELQTRCGIPDEEIGWEMDSSKKVLLTLSFPVLSKDNSISYGESLSDIAIPQRPLSWLYVDYAHVDAVLNSKNFFKKATDKGCNPPFFSIG